MSLPEGSPDQHPLAEKCPYRVEEQRCAEDFVLAFYRLRMEHSVDSKLEEDGMVMGVKKGSCGKIASEDGMRCILIGCLLDIEKKLGKRPNKAALKAFVEHAYGDPEDTFEILFETAFQKLTGTRFRGFSCPE